MVFADIIGQQRTKSLLLQLAQSGRVPHAMLFLGATGSGHLPLAVAFAQLLQCERNTDTTSGGMFGDMEPEVLLTDACGSCASCRKAAAFAHPDIHFSFPTVGTNAVSTDFLSAWRSFLAENPYADVNVWLQKLEADNKQGNINKEECNAILKKLSLKSFEGRYKILLMWLPEYLGKEGNRLLKMIEEPPEQTIFLLVAEQQEQILNTILSRCQLIKTDILSDDNIAQGLIAARGLDAEQAQKIAFLAGGNFGAALSLADNPDSDHAELLLEWLRRCWRGNALEMVKWVESFSSVGRESQKQFLQYGLHFLRELMALSISGSAAVRLRPAEMATAHNMAKVITIEKIEQIAAIFNDNIYFVERNANPKILFLDCSIRLHQILKA
jgi:DNA polymerase III subunit delta'